MSAERDTLALPQPERSASGFHFPYATPYSNQLDLMAALFHAIEHRKVAVMESPTGTGKSLSVICAALTWFISNSRRAQLGSTKNNNNNNNNNNSEEEQEDEPDWVTAHAEAKQRSALLQHEAELNERIERIRKHQKELIAKAAQQSRQDPRPRKKIRLDGDIDNDGEGEDDDARFLPSDLSDSESGPSSISIQKKKKQKNAHFRVLPYTDRITSDTAGQSNEDDNINLNPAVRALIAELAASRPRCSRTRGEEDDHEDEEPESTPKIFFASRTHSQLSQFVQELRKTAFSGSAQDGSGVQLNWTDHHQHTVRAVPLGSRKQLCIHTGVQKLGARRGAEAMNEKCLELMKGGTSKQQKKGGSADAEEGTSKKGRCQFLPSNDALGHAQMLDFRDHALASLHDIEDLAELGRNLNICPYYGARTSARQAELITLPYPLLLSRPARTALALSLKDAIIIIDEAHNLIDTVLSSHSVALSLGNLRAAKAGLDVYLAKFASRLKGVNENAVRKVRAVVGALEEWCVKEVEKAAKEQGKKEWVITSNEFISLVGGTFDQVNFLTLQTYLQESQLLRKVISYIDVQAERAADKAAKAKIAQTATATTARKSSSSKPSAPSKTAKPPAAKGTKVAPADDDDNKDIRDDKTASMAAMMGGMYAIEGFLLSLTNRTDDGRVFVSISPAPSPSPPPAGKGGAAGEKSMVLRYQLLNPADSFAEVVREARSVILLGGTMEPMSDFRTQLFPDVPKDRFTTFSCGHIIPPSNLHAAVLTTAPRTNRAFEFKWDARSDTVLLDDLGTVLLNLCAVVPGGLVVFVPSYGFLEAVWTRWEKSGLLARLDAKKKIFQEPKSTSDVEAVFERYAAVIAGAMTKQVKTNPAQTPSTSGSAATPTGALMFAVVGAKLSEGINFSDDLARAVVMVGMPFANAASPELAERMRYVRELAKTSGGLEKSASKLDAGNELYLNMCMKAVNQSIGRAIRHKNDYAALILLDRRYARPDIRNRLPGWIRNEVKTVEQFGPAMAGLGAFFRGKKQQQAVVV
ncbi:unnamed protein product [Tilletia laevis]|uniref:ATP-dependent DNA helicase CHL1 n=2 Tax=Tilletia caries TaxID=13290 RepID=A0ABN7INK2_9BASI|nr:hypothetical protein CF336_g1982 [Tilletia laevis]CAD6914062.1 unnamed protein product [Tilletia caries]CAD6984858.1 unnamed protein product [Tilletia controversa]KAE8207185.1 hypothetical protein CF335_g1327 [Tilletia laevis]CAD6942898.1 unnamed protein product [Tilletia laevis]